MTFGEFPNDNNELDSNYIYPKPYIDPMMYVNPYNNMLGSMPMFNMPMSNYSTYMNPYMANSYCNFESQDNNVSSNSDNTHNQDAVANGMNPQMMQMMQMQMMNPQMLMQMMQLQMQMMMPDMSPINMEELDEEEM